MSEQIVKKRSLISRLTVNPVCNFIFGEPTEYEMQPVSKVEYWGLRIILAVVVVAVVSVFIGPMSG